MTDLDANLDALEKAVTEVRQVFEIDRDDAYLPGHATRRFRHLILLECAERMDPEAFALCIAVARQQLRRPPA